MKIGRLNIKFQSPVVLSLQPTYMQVVIAELQQGRKLGAIKAYKTATGVGLREAKEFVDSLYDKYLVRQP